MVKGDNKVGEDKICEAEEVGEMVAQEGVLYNQERKSSIMMTSSMLTRQSHLTE